MFEELEFKDIRKKDLENAIRMASDLDQVTKIEKLEGGLNQIYQVKTNEKTLIYKFNTHKEEISHFTTEYQILKKLEDKKPPTPRPEYFVKKTDFVKHGFIVMQKLEGLNPEKKLEYLSRENKEKFFKQYGNHLATIHNTEKFPRYGSITTTPNQNLIPEEAAETWKEYLTSKTLERIEHARNQVTRFQHTGKKIKSIFQQYNKLIPSIDKGRLLRFDNRLENTLINEKGDVKGLLDWNAMLSGDPFYDLVRTETLMVDWDLIHLDPTKRENLKQQIYKGYQQVDYRSMREENTRSLYRLATIAMLMSGYTVWGDQNKMLADNILTLARNELENFQEIQARI